LDIDWKSNFVELLKLCRKPVARISKFFETFLVIFQIYSQ